MKDGELAVYRAAIQDHAARVDALAGWLDDYGTLPDEAVEEEIYTLVEQLTPVGENLARESFYTLLEDRKILRPGTGTSRSWTTSGCSLGRWAPLPSRPATFLVAAGSKKRKKRVPPGGDTQFITPWFSRV